MSARKKRILIVNVNWIGDVIFSTPFISAVRAAYPGSRIACLVHPRCVEVLEGNPRIDDTIVYDEEGAHKGIAGKLKLALRLRRERFDTAFLLHRSFTKALLVFAAGIAERIGYPTKRRGLLLTKQVELPDEGTHKVEYFLNIARSCGMRPRDVRYEFPVDDADRKHIVKLLRDNGIGEKDTLAVLCPGGNWDMKRWPWRNFARLTDMLASGLGAKVVISGAAKDTELAGRISSAAKQKPVVCCGKTPLKTLGALLERADIVIANDTGPMHIAVAVGSRVIALFGPTSPELTGPYGLGTYKVIWKNTACETPCYDVTCSENACMALIEPEEVFEEAKRMLAGAKA
jgi:lipopolysaccharide heptosyltransferase II